MVLMAGQMRTPSRLRDLLARSLAATAIGLVLVSCTAEGTHSPKAGLTTDAATAVSKSGTANPVAAQAFAGSSESKVEASTEALAKGEGLHLDPDKTSGKFSLFKSKKSRASERSRTVKVSARKRSKMIELPGVKKRSIFSARSVARKAKSLSEPVRTASAAALSRIGRQSLRKQHSKVSVKCLKPELVRLIKRAERHFGRHAVVTSGYRSPRHNRRIGGARNSMHVSCQAADIQIQGISKWTLASWFRKQDGRGGVGTYCHTASVHIDIGKKRDWNWRCKRRRGKRRKA